MPVTGHERLGRDPPRARHIKILENKIEFYERMSEDYKEFAASCRRELAEKYGVFLVSHLN